MLELQRTRIVNLLLTGHCQIIQLLKSNKFNRACITRSARQPNDPAYIIGRLHVVDSSPGTRHLNRQFFIDRTRALRGLNRRSRVPHLLTCFRTRGSFCLIRRVIRNELLQRRLTDHHPVPRHCILRLLGDLLPIITFIRDQKIVRHSVGPSGVVHHGASEQLILVSFKTIGSVSARLTSDSVRRASAIKINARNCVPDRRTTKLPGFYDSLCTLNVATLRTLANVPTCTLGHSGGNRLV